MRKFKVKALSFHSDKVQIIYKAGDEITEDVMHADQIEKHIEDGFIEEITEAPAQPKAAPTEETMPETTDEVETPEEEAEEETETTVEPTEETTDEVETPEAPAQPAKATPKKKK